MLTRFWNFLLLLLFVGGGIVAGVVFGLIPAGVIPLANHQPPAPAPVVEAARQPLPIPVTVTSAVPRSVERRAIVKSCVQRV